MATFIEGYLATITINGVAYEPYTSDATLDLVRDAIDKTKLGNDRRDYVSGLGDGNVDATLHLATEFAVAINVAYESTVAVAVVFRPGALGTKDAGQYGGEGVITSFSQQGTADGEWDVSLSIQMSGALSYTAPV